MNNLYKFPSASERYRQKDIILMERLATEIETALLEITKVRANRMGETMATAQIAVCEYLWKMIGLTTDNGVTDQFIFRNS